MGENWFQREFLQPKRLAFNVIFYGLHLFFFAYGWYSQVRRPTLPLCRVSQTPLPRLGN